MRKNKVVKKKLNIVMATHGYKPATKIGGPIVSVASVAERLVQRGHNVTVLTSDSNNTGRLDIDTERPHVVNGVVVWYGRTVNVTEDFFGSKKPRRRLGYLYAPNLRKITEKYVKAADVVHLQMPFVYPTFIAGWFAIKNQIPYVYQQRGVFDTERMKVRSLKKKIVFQIREKWVLKHADALVALTNWEILTYKNLGLKNRIIRIPNGIDIPKYVESAAARDVLEEFELDPEKPTILFLGRVQRTKGVALLVDAFLKAKKINSNLQLVIAGPDEDGIGKSIVNRISSVPESKDIRFVGHVEGIRKNNLLSACQLFCLPSIGEGFSMAVLEALAAGTRVLLSPGCHFPEVVSAGVGDVVPLDVNEIATKLVQLTATSSNSMCEKKFIRKFVEDHYSWDLITDSLEKSYYDILSS